MAAAPNSRAPLGQGGRFASLQNKIEKSGSSSAEAGAIAANAGRAKYGKAGFQAMAAAGKK